MMHDIFLIKLIHVVIIYILDYIASICHNSCNTDPHRILCNYKRGFYQCETCKNLGHCSSAYKATYIFRIFFPLSSIARPYLLYSSLAHRFIESISISIKLYCYLHSTRSNTLLVCLVSFVLSIHWCFKL
jgi:hypothetical protein